MAGHTAFTLKSTSNKRNNILKEDNEIRPKEDNEIRQKGDNEIRSRICNFNENDSSKKQESCRGTRFQYWEERKKQDIVTKPLGCYTWTVSRTTLMNIGK